MSKKFYELIRHRYAKELNRLYLITKGQKIDITDHYNMDYINNMAKDYKSLVRAIRHLNRPYTGCCGGHIKINHNNINYSVKMNSKRERLYFLETREKYNIKTGHIKNKRVLKAIGYNEGGHNECK